MGGRFRKRSQVSYPGDSNGDRDDQNQHAGEPPSCRACAGVQDREHDQDCKEKELPGIRLEQIVSNGQASAEGFWYDQKNPEWVMLVRGETVLRFDPDGDVTRPATFC